MDTGTFLLPQLPPEHDSVMFLTSLPLHGCPPADGGGLVQFLVYIAGLVQNLVQLPATWTVQGAHCPSTEKKSHLKLIIIIIRIEGNVLFNDALNTFYLWLYGIRHMVKDHSDSERGNTLPPHGLLFPISSKGSFICTIPQTG